MKIASFYAPTIKVKVPAAAPVTPPETGASTKVISCCFPVAFKAIATDGEIVLQSMMSEPLAAFLNNPPSD